MTVPVENEYRVGDVITITPTGTATLDSGFESAGVVTANVATVLITAKGSGTITVSVPVTQAAITLTGDSVGSDALNHFETSLADFQSICSIKEWSLSLERETLDISTLPCKPCQGEAGGKFAPFRQTAPGFASAEGSMTVLFSKDLTNAANRLLANSMLADQGGAEAKFYLDAVCGDSGVDDSLSNYIQTPITLLGFEVTVNTEDAVEATVNFGFAGQPSVLFGVTLTD